jgi:predicted transport protein
MSFYSLENYNKLKNKIINLYGNNLDDFDKNYNSFKLDNAILSIKYETEYINKKFMDRFYPYDTFKKVKDTQDWTVDDYRNLNLHTDDTIVIPEKNNIPWRQKIGHFIKSVERDIDETLPNTLNPKTPTYKSFNSIMKRTTF